MNVAIGVIMSFAFICSIPASVGGLIVKYFAAVQFHEQQLNFTNESTKLGAVCAGALFALLFTIFIFKPFRRKDVD